MINRLLRFVIAILLCTTIISIGSTQIVLASINGFGIEVDLITRLNTTFSDLIGLGPIVIVIVACAYLIGFTLAFLLSKLVLPQQTWGIIAGLTAVPSAVALMNHVLDLQVLFMTTLITGWVVLVIASLSGSLLYHQMAPDNHDKE